MLSRFIYTFFFLLILVPGCRVQRSQKKAASSRVQEIEARYDIPFPLGAKLTTMSSDTSKEYLQFKIPSSLEQVRNFYELEMERLGWRLEAQCQSDKTFCYWRKPHRWCAIILSFEKSITLEDLFIGF